MPLHEDPPLHDFPDRAIRRLLEDPHNLRDLLAAVLPDLVDRFDFAHVEPVGREFLLENWRRRESDLLFRLPWDRSTEEGVTPPALVCVLIEHQSDADVAMPLRILIYAALYWEGEWKAWQTEHARGEPLRLSPVVPIVFHTGGEPWRTHRTLATMIGGPDELARFAPRWEPLFWDLAERTPDELIAASGELLASLAVVRAERAGETEFQELFARLLRRLEPLSEQERVRWDDLLWFVLSWALRRRPSTEQERLIATARTSQQDTRRREEIERMAETIARNWEEELLARGEARGEARGRVAGQLEVQRENLLWALRQRFGSVPEELEAQINSVADLDRLRAAFQQSFQVTSLEDLAI